MLNFNWCNSKLAIIEVVIIGGSIIKNLGDPIADIVEKLYNRVVLIKFETNQGKTSIILIRIQPINSMLAIHYMNLL